MEAEHAAGSGLTLEERISFAEGMVRTMGLTVRPAHLFCGHGSHNINNPSASAPDCGACGGAPG